MEANDDDVVDYEEAPEGDIEAESKAVVVPKQKGGASSVNTTNFRDFMLKPELSRAIGDCGFEHPSEVQSECIPQAVLGFDVICQAKSGMGKTAVFVLSTLHLLAPVDGEIHVLVMCHSRELAFQIQKEYERFSKFLPEVRSRVFFGGINIAKDIEALKTNCPHIAVGTPGRIKELACLKKVMDLSKIKIFVLDECDSMLAPGRMGRLDMRQDVQSIFMVTNHEKQVMMFSATLASDIRPVCRKFCQEPREMYVDDNSKLTLHSLQQYYIRLSEGEKNRKLNELLDALEFNQVVIFVNKVQRAVELHRLLEECNFPSVCITGQMKTEDRMEKFKDFKDFKKRILVCTDLLGRGVDIERVNIVINYDFPDKSDQYLHRVCRAGRFGTKGLAISFVSTSTFVASERTPQSDSEVLAEVQERFTIQIPVLPAEIDQASYMA